MRIVTFLAETKPTSFNRAGRGWLTVATAQAAYLLLLPEFPCQSATAHPMLRRFAQRPLLHYGKNLSIPEFLCDAVGRAGGVHSLNATMLRSDGVF